jgi:serine/threonine protein kinase
MDRDYNVILADFDIAKKHTSKTQDITDSKVSHLTVKYAPKRVKEQRQRGRDWDIYSLGCVFLEIATVTMGETMTNLHRHLICGDDAPQERWQEVELYYYEAVENKHVDSWIDHLKQSFRCLPQQEAPVTMFASDKVKQRFKDSESCLEEFFRQIHNMLHAKPGDQGILEEAVNCFNLLSEKDCQHCFSKVCKPAHVAARSNLSIGWREREQYSPTSTSRWIAKAYGSTSV